MQNFIAQAKFDANQVAKFAKIAVTNPDIAMAALRSLSNAENMIDALVAYPGAIEALYRNDNCPRMLKGFLAEALEASGHVILS